MLRELNGSKLEDVVLYAVETRSSSSVRISRDEQYRSVSHPDVYPAGESSGYAGGIVSSVVDGLKATERVVEVYRKGVRSWVMCLPLVAVCAVSPPIQTDRYHRFMLSIDPEIWVLLMSVPPKV